MQTIPFGGLSIRPGAEPDGYDEQKDLIERGMGRCHGTMERQGPSCPCRFVAAPVI